MKLRRILIIQGHPDAAQRHYGHALADAYAEAAQAAGHDVRRIEVARLRFECLRSVSEWHQPPASDIVAAQEAIRWAEHLVIVFPLWLGTMPALLKAFLEQVLRPGFGVALEPPATPTGQRELAGKSARVVVTMGMPALVYRWYFRAHGVRGFERNILRFCGISRIDESLIGLVEGSAARRERWLARLGKYGRDGW